MQGPAGQDVEPVVANRGAFPGRSSPLDISTVVQAFKRRLATGTRTANIIYRYRVETRNP
jgi:hypothetical protein